MSTPKQIELFNYLLKKKKETLTDLNLSLLDVLLDWRNHMLHLVILMTSEPEDGFEDEELEEVEDILESISGLDEHIKSYNARIQTCHVACRELGYMIRDG